MRVGFSRSQPGASRRPAASVRFVIKRSFRFGLLVGLLGGLALALLKAFSSGREEEPAPAPAPAGPGPARGTPWPRLDADPAVPAAPRLGLVPDPDAPAAPVPDPTPVRGPVAMAPAAADEEPAPAAAPAVPKAPKHGKAAETGKAAKAGKAVSSPAKASKAAKKPTKKKAAAKRAWVEPDGDVCPTSHPVKAKLGSKIFHVPGGLSYDRTRPDRCYRDAAAAEADGLRPAKR